MGKNHDIRFDVTTEERAKAESIYLKNKFIKKTEFFKMIFFLGVDSFQANLFKGLVPYFFRQEIKFKKEK